VKVSPTVYAEQARLETERDALTRELQTLRDKASAAATNVVKQRVGNMVGALKCYADDPASPLHMPAPVVNAMLRECFERAVIDYRSGELVMHWRQGPPPSVIRYKAAVFARGD
jgi:hypothetical protein